MRGDGLGGDGDSMIAETLENRGGATFTRTQTRNLGSVTFEAGVALILCPMSSPEPTDHTVAQGPPKGSLR